MNKYKTGVLIGRFQPFHKGHLYLLQESLKLADRIIIGIGTANRVDPDNPWTTKERRAMIERVLEKEKLKSRVIKIVDVNDYLEDDEKWYREVDKEVGSVELVVGNNDWVNDLYKRYAAYPVDTTHVDLYKRYLLEGYKIRELIRKGGVWQDRVPEYLVDLIRTTI